MSMMTALKGFLRSLLLQVGWNSERMQNLGFSYTLIPFLENFSEEERKEKLSRHLEFFNTHPYMAGSLAAAVGKMEIDGEKEEDIRAFKQSMMGPFGALGDSLFWCSLKPVAVLVGVALALAGKFLSAVIATLLLYNVFHIWMRVWSYQGGIKEGAKMVTRISRLRFARINAALGITAAVTVAVIAVFELGSGKGFIGETQFHNVYGAFAAILVLLGAVAVKVGLRPIMLLYLVAGFGLAASLAVL